MAQPTGDQIIALKESLMKKLEELDKMIGEDQDNKDGTLAQLRELQAKLAELDGRLAKMKAARKEYAKTIQEVDFALQKIEETAQVMSERFGKLAKVQIDI